MKNKRLTGHFYEYMRLNFGINTEIIDNMLQYEIKRYIDSYLEELEKEIYHYSIIVAERKNNSKEETEYKVMVGEYEITVVKKFLSIAVYMKKPASKYRKLIKCYSLFTLEETIKELKKQLTLNEIIYN